MVYALAGEYPVPMGTLERFSISCASARAGPLIGLRLTHIVSFTFVECAQSV